jgi:very-short-patch-repair endonuclease
MPFKDRMKTAKFRYAQEMHQNPTPSEAALWDRLKGSQLRVPFLSQELILGYIVDFYCPPARLVVEVDGGVHQTAKQRAYDSEKDRALRRRGFRILRLPSDLSASDAVTRIDRKLHFLQVGRKAGRSETGQQKKNLAA